MSASQWASLVELPRERFGALSRVIPDTPWTTTALHAIQGRKAAVYVDVPDAPGNLAVCVRGGDDPGDHDQAYVFGLPSVEPLRAFVASVARATEFIVDDDLVGMVQEIHPVSTPREAMCCWYETLATPKGAPRVNARHLRVADADAAQKLIPRWALRTFESVKDMILGGGCFGVDVQGRLASVAYVADQSIKYARVAAFTAEPYRRRGFAMSALHKLVEHVTNDGRLVCTLAPRRNAAAVHLALKMEFPGKALLRTYKVQPGADSQAAESTSSAAQTEA